MTGTHSPIRRRLDRAGIWLSALCAVHCAVGVLLVAGVGLGGSFLLNPVFHEAGLVISMLIVGVAIGIGAFRHGRPLPISVAVIGLIFMGGALAVGHGTEEAVLTVIGVVLVATGHILNLRQAH